MSLAGLTQHERKHELKKDKKRKAGVAKISPGPVPKPGKKPKDLAYMKMLTVDPTVLCFAPRVSSQLVNPNIVFLGDSDVAESDLEVIEVYNGDRLQLTTAQKILVLDYHAKNGSSIRSTCKWVCVQFNRRTYDRKSLRNLRSPFEKGVV